MTPERIDSTMRSCSARRLASVCVVAASCTSERDCRSASFAASRPTTRNETSERPSAWIVLAIDSSVVLALIGPIPLIASSAQALNAATLPTEVIIAPRGPMNRLATEMTTMYSASCPPQPGDQKYIDEKLNAGLSQKVSPEHMRGAVNQGEPGNCQDNRRYDAE